MVGRRESGCILKPCHCKDVMLRWAFWQPFSNRTKFWSTPPSRPPLTLCHYGSILDLEVGGDSLTSTGVQTFQIDFRYERLPSFCFHCGRIGHSDRGCDMLADIGLRDGNIVMNYGPCLRVSFGPKSNTEEDEWMKDGDVHKGSADEVHETGSRVIILRGEEDTTPNNGDEGRVKSNQITNPLFLDENEDVEMTSAVDAKRKRVEKSVVINLNRKNDESNGAVVSKNELSAGPGVQARRSQ